jgi:predicted nuclease of predicted toxin-antitoxin system
VRLFIDECLSPALAERLWQAGIDAVHPLHVGRRGEQDHTVIRRCLEEDRVVVTQNTADFRRLLRRVEMHAGLILLPPVGRERSWALLQAALAYIAASGNPEPTHYMTNRVVTVDDAGGVVDEVLP